MKHILIKDDAPMVSIIVPAYNAQKFIASTLDSLVKQQFPSFEIIVVDDGSTDQTENIVRHFFFDRRIKYFKKQNGGTGDALNFGHRYARGRYITWCSADNIYLPNFVLELANALHQCEQQRVPVEFVYSDFMYIDANNNKLHDVIHEKPQTREDLVNGYDLGMSFMYTANLWRKTGLYSKEICEDYEWVTRAAKHTHFGLVKLVLAAFRVHGNQITGSNKEREKAASDFCKQQAKKFLDAGEYGEIRAAQTFKPILVEDAPSN